MDSDDRNHVDVVTEAEQVRAREAPAAGDQLSRVDYDAELRMHNEYCAGRTAFVPTITSSTSGAGPGRRRVTRRGWPGPVVWWGWTSPRRSSSEPAG